MKLITEEVTNVKILTEGKGANKKLYIEGVFLQGEIKNRNGRMYPMSTLAREVGRYNETFVNKGRALGELGHPDGPTVNLDRVSHKITSLERVSTGYIRPLRFLMPPCKNTPSMYSFLLAPLPSVRIFTFVTSSVMSFI